MILAGGRGERMRPLTDIRPKPMIEIAGKPFLEHQILLLRDQGFKKFLLLLGYLPDVVKNYFGDGGKWGVQIDYSVTAVEDLTGRRVKLAENKLDEIFLLVYCDNYWPLPMEKMWRRFTEVNAPMMVTVYSNKDNYTKSVLKVDDAGFVSVYDKQEKNAGFAGNGNQLRDHPPRINRANAGRKCFVRGNVVPAAHRQAAACGVCHASPVLQRWRHVPFADHGTIFVAAARNHSGSRRRAE